MKLIKIFPVLLILSEFISTPAFSQDAPITWGNIPSAQLKMTSFPQDTNASAVILCDYGLTNFNDDLFLVYKRHLRVKILSPRGYSWGTHSVVLYTSNTREHIHDIQGTTYALRQDGSVEKHELEQKDIFSIKLDDDYTKYTFTLPALQSGCVIELRYTIISEYIEFKKTNVFQSRNWVFQYSDPVLWSEYRVIHPQAISYATWTHGYEPFAVNEISEVTQNFSGDAGYYLCERSIILGKPAPTPCWQRRWVVKNAPAVRKEPYITNFEDYANSVNLQLSGYILYGQFPVKFCNTWPAFVDELLDSKNFGGRMDETRKLRTQAVSIIGSLTDPRKKLKALYDWTRNSIVTEDLHSITTKRDVNDVLETHKGDHASTSFVLLGLLHAAGLQAEPVILSTRDQMCVQEKYPIISEFNDILVRVRIDSTLYYIDASDPLRPLELLPPEVLNERGLVVQSHNPEWITLKAEYGFCDTSRIFVNTYANGEGRIHGSDVFFNYGALEMRSFLQKHADNDVGTKLSQGSHSDFEIDSVLINGKDSLDASLTVRFRAHSNGDQSRTGDVVSFNPHIIRCIDQNPFVTEYRKYPVDYAYTRKQCSIIDVEPPDNYVLQDTVPSRSITLEPNLAFYSRQFRRVGNHIQIIRTFEIQKSEINARYYRDLREFYSRVVDTESEQLVYARIQKPAVPLHTVSPQQKGKQ